MNDKADINYAATAESEESAPKPLKLKKITIHSPVELEFLDEDISALRDILGRACKRYEAQNPERTCWPFGEGCGSNMSIMWMGEDPDFKFLDDEYEFEVAEREKFPSETKH